MDTSSWRELDGGPSWRERLVWLHDDYFYRRQEALWKAHALRTLPVLMRATDCLVCGEDLGMIPACVSSVMEQLGLVGVPSSPRHLYSCTVCLRFRILRGLYLSDLWPFYLLFTAGDLCMLLAPLQFLNLCEILAAPSIRPDESADLHA